MQRRSGPRKETKAEVSWEEVWQWCDDIQKRWGYWTTVRITQGIAAKPDVRFVVTAEMTIMNVNSGQMNTKIWQSKSVTNKAATAESVALGIVSGIFMRLDREEDEAERAALQAGLPF